MRLCRRCLKSKRFSEFYQKANSQTSWCRECCREYAREFKATSGYTAEKIKRMENMRQGLRYDGKPLRLRSSMTLLDKRARQSFKNALKRSIRGGSPFDLTADWVQGKFREFAAGHFTELSNGSPFRPSLDRIDSKGHYQMSNVRVCWLIENYARNAFEDKDLIDFCKMKLGISIRPE